jgi:sialate O-acetylesterase
MFLHRASGFFNGCIAPLAPCAMRGVVWYQGETNDSRGYQYRFLFPALIRDWRRAWGGREFPFLFVQVANVLPPDPEPVNSEWAELRESQALALALPNTGMAVTIDIGEENDVHPKNKQDVGHRLALVARARAHGENDLPFAGPTYDRMSVEDGKLRVFFKHIDGGLVCAGERLATFAVAGADRAFVWADAAIDGDTVVVGSDRVRAPVAVRYAWANNPAGCNLYNAAGLPGTPGHCLLTSEGSSYARSVSRRACRHACRAGRRPVPRRRAARTWPRRTLPHRVPGRLDHRGAHVAAAFPAGPVRGGAARPVLLQRRHRRR